MDIFNIEKDGSFSNALQNNKDDLYNLSTRKKTAVICLKLIENINKLNLCYESITTEDEIIEKYISDNKQILIICNKIYNAVAVKGKKINEQIKTDNNEVRLFICALLSEIANGIISLSNIISIRHIERELIYASEIILRQLMYMLPYKIY